MTNRQKKLGVTEYGYQRGIKDGEFMADHEAFLAKLATVKKGQYNGKDIIRMWFPEYADMDGIINLKHQDAIPFFLGLTAIMPEHIYYSCTHDLDVLTLK